MADLDAALRELVREELRAALEEQTPLQPRAEPDDGWRARIHRVPADTRLTLAEASEALGVSERSVRRYVKGEGDYPLLPSAKGPTGLTVRAGDLLSWLEDVEGANRFRAAAGGGG